MKRCCDAIKLEAERSHDYSTLGLCNAGLEAGKPRREMTLPLWALQKGRPLPAACCGNEEPERDYCGLQR